MRLRNIIEKIEEIRLNVFISHTPGEEIFYCGGLIKDSKSFVIYTAIADIDNPFYISKNFVLEAIQKGSILLRYNYEYILTGRKYYQSLDLLAQSKLESLLYKRLKFLKPSRIYIPSFKYNSSTCKLNKAIRSIDQDKVDLLNYGDIDHNYFVRLNKEFLEDKRRSLSYFGKLWEGKEVSPIEKYKILSSYYEIPNTQKEQSEAKDTESLSE